MGTLFVAARLMQGEDFAQFLFGQGALPDREFVEHSFELQGGNVLGCLQGLSADLLKGFLRKAVVQHELQTPFARRSVLQTYGHKYPFAGRYIRIQGGSVNPIRCTVPCADVKMVRTEEIKTRHITRWINFLMATVN